MVSLCPSLGPIFQPVYHCIGLPDYGIYALVQSGGLLNRGVLEKCLPDKDPQMLADIERTMRQDFQIKIT